MEVLFKLFVLVRLKARAQKDANAKNKGRTFWRVVVGDIALNVDSGISKAEHAVLCTYITMFLQYISLVNILI